MHISPIQDNIEDISDFFFYKAIEYFISNCLRGNNYFNNMLVI